MTRYCASCGTEVDENAIFCPTCGQPIDQETETEMPAAPAWPAPDPGASPQPAGAREPEPAAEVASFPEPEVHAEPPAAVAPMRDEDDDGHAWRADAADRAPWSDEPTRTAAAVEPRATPPAPAPPPAAAPPVSPADPRPSGSPAGPSASVPFTAPVTMSAWLIGVGAVVAALGALIGLFDSSGLAIDLLTLVATLGLAATVFFPTALPAIPHLRFITLVVVLVAFGVGLDRLGEGRAGAGDLLLFLGAAAAVIGAVLLELGHDQPLGGPQT